MADQFVSSSSYYLSGGGLGGKLAISKFSGLKMEVGVSSVSAGKSTTGKTHLEPRPGPNKPGTPSFVCTITQGDVTLSNWWVVFNPNATSGQYKPQDMTFTLESEGRPVAEWQLKGVFPKSYELSDADAGSSELATETITLAVTEIERTV